MVPQGSVQFLLYTAELLQRIESHHFHLHLYADGTQIYEFCAPNESQSLQIHLTACIDHVGEWMRLNRLQLNTTVIVYIISRSHCEPFSFVLAPIPITSRPPPSSGISTYLLMLTYR